MLTEFESRLLLLHQTTKTKALNAGLNYSVSKYGESSWLIQCESEDVLPLAQAIRRVLDTSRLGSASIEIVPGAKSVLITCADLTVDVNKIEGLVSSIDLAQEKTDNLPLAPAFAPISIPVTYDGIDLKDVASRLGLSISEVVALHCSSEYVVSFCGFSPGFAYLSGLHPKLAIPRRSTPREKISKGSIAIAEGYSAVYPGNSPGGWHVLGTTQMPMFDSQSKSPSVLTPGARVRFVQIAGGSS